MSEKIQRYLDDVLSYVRCRDVHDEIRLELESHVADRVDALRQAGVPEAEAVERALRQMGEAAEVGLGLHRANRPRTDWKLLILGAGLVLAGIWIMYAVSVSDSYAPELFHVQVRWSAQGAVVAVALFFLDYRRLRPLGWPLFIVATVLVSLVLFLNRDWQWMLGSTVAHPMVFVPGLAALLADWDWRRRWAGWILAAMGAVPSLQYVTVDRYRYVPVYLVLWAVMVLLSRPRWRQDLWPSAVTGLAGAVLSLWARFQQPYLVESIQVWLHPLRDIQGAAFVAFHSVKTLKEAGLWGHGPLAKLILLPDPHMSMVFPYLVHTLGWVGGGAVCLLAVLFLVRLAGMARQSRDRFGHFLVAGVGAVFAMQFGWNIAMTAGWLPITAVDLPFFSFGRQQIVQLAAVGLALSVFRRKDLGKATPMRPGMPTDAGARDCG